MEENTIASAKENSVKKYYERMLKAAEAETRRREEEEQRDLLTEDPLGQNYARWATEEEFCQSLVEVPIEGGEVERSGVPMFCRDGISYVDPSDSHTLIIGASGSKKTRLFILPSILNLCKAGESMVVTDPKAELYERTSAMLKENGYKIYCINFRDDSCQNSWNPLEAPRKFFLNGKFDLAVGLLNDFATVSIAKDSRNMSDPFWDDCARATFMGLLLLLFMLSENPEEINIRSLIRLRHTLLNNMKAKNGKNLLSELLRLAGPDSLASSYLAMVATVPEKTYASILATLDSHLLKFIIRPSLTDMLCHNDIDFHKMGEEKTAVFLVMPDEKETYHGMISIFVQQCYESLIFAAQQEEKKTLKRRVNFLLDEFSSLPPIKEFPAMIAAARSRNIRFDIVVQSEKQLVSRYHEEADTIKGNCNNWIYLYSRELKTLNELSELCGVQKSGKPLVTVSKLQRLSKENGEVLIIHGRQYPFLSHLEDISRYDHETFGQAVFESVNPEPVRIFHIEEMIEKHNEDWMKARMTQDSQKELEALVKEEEERKKKEEEARRREEARILEETRKAAQNALTALPWLPIQAEAPTGGRVKAANRRWFEAHREELEAAAAKISAKDICRVVRPEPGTSDPTVHRILPKSPFAMNYLPMVTQLNAERIALLNSDPEQGTAAAASIYLSALYSGQMIPLYFDQRNLVTDWAHMYDSKKKVEPLLALLLTRQLFGGEMPVMPELGPDETLDEPPELDPGFAADVQELLNELQKKPAGRPEYLLIIDRMDEAPNAVDAIWQPMNLGDYPNVQLVVILNAERTNMLKHNCIFFMNYSKKQNTNVSQKFTLCFNEETNEVEAKQGPVPKLWIELDQLPNQKESGQTE